MFLAAVFFLSTLYDVTIYISTSLSQGPIKLTSKQMEMLKVEKTGELFGHAKGFMIWPLASTYRMQVCIDSTIHSMTSLGPRPHGPTAREMGLVTSEHKAWSNWWPTEELISTCQSHFSKLRWLHNSSSLYKSELPMQICWSLRSEICLSAAALGHVPRAGQVKQADQSHQTQ